MRLLVNIDNSLTGTSRDMSESNLTDVTKTAFEEPLRVTFRESYSLVYIDDL